MSEALERLHKHSNYMCIYDFDEDDDYNIIKSALERKDQLEIENADLKVRNEKLEKAWEIVKTKIVCLNLIRICKNYIEYNDLPSVKINKYDNLTEEEFNLLKEVIK